MSDELLYFNGINGASGAYDVPPLSSQQLSRLIQRQPDPDNLSELKLRRAQDTADTLGVREGVEPRDLSQAGWGVIFPRETDPAVKEALEPLLALRRSQAGSLFRVFENGGGYQPGQSKAAFLSSYGMGPGPANPEKVPYYLLLVGSPEQIPYHFQYQLDVQYAVGRIWFETPAEYDYYARSVVAAETGHVRLPRQAALWGVENPDDPATGQEMRSLVSPLLARLRKENPGWQIQDFLRADASKARLSELLGGEQTPALLFTASHGMSFPLKHARQRPHQGALLCQDWPGPRAWQQGIPQDFYFAGDDVSSDASLLGLISFHYACYGAGTPQHDEFARLSVGQSKQIAPYSMLAGLPLRLLGHPRGGALAVIGHIDRAWSYSYNWTSAGAQTAVFESALQRLMNGDPVGYALEYFNERYAELSSDLSIEIEAAEYGKKVNPNDLAAMWTANNDARSYVVLGDPAVRLVPQQETSAETGRATIDLTSPAPALAQATMEPEATMIPISGPLAGFMADELVAEFGVSAVGREDQDPMTAALEQLAQQLADFLEQSNNSDAGGSIAVRGINRQANTLLRSIRNYLDS